MRLSTFVGAVNWTSAIILLWLMVLGSVENSTTTWFAFWFFVVMGLLSGAASLYDPDAYRKRKQEKMQDRHDIGT